MRFVQIEMLPGGQALVAVDKITHAVTQEAGTRLFPGGQPLDVPHTLAELENVLAGRERGNNGQESTAGWFPKTDAGDADTHHKRSGEIEFGRCVPTASVCPDRIGVSAL